MAEFGRFTEKAQKALNTAIETAMLLGHTYIGTEHLLYALSATENSVAEAILENRNIESTKIMLKLETVIGRGMQTKLALGDITPRCKKVLESAVALAVAENKELAGTEHILRAITADESSYGCIFLRELGADTEQVYDDCAYCMPYQKGGNVKKGGFRAKTEKNEYLCKYGRDLTEMAEKGETDALVGRDKEIERLIQTLLRRRKNNPCLIGESGVGKTAIVEGFARRVVEDMVPDELKGKRIFMLDLTSMLAGAKYRGDFEERIKTAVDEVIKDKNTILFIDEIHNIVGTGAAEGAVDAANILKPLLARGEFRLIGATTNEEYRKYIEKDNALERRFQPIAVDEPDEKTTESIIFGLRSRYEEHHKVRISDEAVKAAVKLSVRYINDRFLPDKAIDLIDEAASKLRLGKAEPSEVLALRERRKVISNEKLAAIKAQDYEKAAKIRDEERQIAEKLNSISMAGEKTFQRVLSAENIETTVAEWTGIPVKSISADEHERLRMLEDNLKREIVGQDEAIAKLSSALRRSKTGFSDPERPIGTFMFLGPTGVGKTHVCRILSRVFFGSEKSLVRLDMSEFMEAHSVSKLIGSPPGYVGFENGGMLVERVRKQPYSVVLFDEIEKAHADVLNILLQILEDGALTASDGRKASFKNTVIIMTGNIGGTEITSNNAKIGFGESSADEYTAERIEKRLKEVFKPEFLNRVDEKVIFKELSSEQLKRICMILLKKTAERAAEKGIELKFTAAAVEKIADDASKERNGARPLKRIIAARIEKLVSDKIIDKVVEKGSKVLIDECGGEFLLKQLQTEAQSDKI